MHRHLKRRHSIMFENEKIFLIKRKTGQIQQLSHFILFLLTSTVSEINTALSHPKFSKASES